MKDTSYTKKVGEEYKTMISQKEGQYGFQYSYTPEFQKAFADWLRSQDGTYFNMNIKEWDSKPTQQASYPEEDDSNSIPF